MSKLESSKNFIRFMLDVGVLRFGDFTTKSGRQTPYFVNTGAYRSGSHIRRLSEFYADAAIEASGVISIISTVPRIRAFLWLLLLR